MKIDLDKLMSDTRYTQVILARIIYGCLFGMFALGVLSYFVNPVFEKGAWVTQEALMNALSAALGAKFGMAIPKGQVDPKTYTVRNVAPATEGDPNEPAGRSQ